MPASSRAWSRRTDCLYAIAGGIPDYLEEFDDGRLSTTSCCGSRSARRAPVSRGNRPASSEFSEPRTYETIVRAIAHGRTRRLIATSAGLGAQRTTPYLDRLQELDLVTRRTPPGDATQPRPRISQYVLSDPYLRFYYALVDPWRSAIALGQGKAVLAEVGREAIGQYVSRVFEDVVAQYLRRLSGAGQLGPLSEVGFWWFAGGDIDAAGLAGGRLVAAASAKWTKAQVKPGDLDDLRRSVATVAPASEPALYLVGRTGFDRNLADAAGVTLVGLRDLFHSDLEYER
jgi:hypothetical protein